MRIQFPLGGLNRAAAYQSQPPYTGVDMLNVRPTDTMQGRKRGGSRPGTLRTDPVSIGARVRLLAAMTIADAAATAVDRSFTAANWSAASWVTNGAPTIDDYGLLGSATGATESDNERGLKSSFTAYSASSLYRLGVLIVPVDGSFATATDKYDLFSIFARGNNTTPLPRSSGIEAKLALANTGSNTHAIWRLYSNGSEVSAAANFSTSINNGRNSAWFEIEVNADAVTAWYNGTVLYSAQSVTANAGQLVYGISMGYGTESDPGGN